MIASALGQLNPISMLAHVIYDVANSMTSVVGLTPVQVAEGLGVLLFLSFVVQMVQSIRGRASWDLSARSVAPDDVQAMRDELDS